MNSQINNININSIIENLINANKQQGYERTQTQIISTPDAWPICEDAKTGKKFVNWCSNSYLGLHAHPKVINAAVEATQKYGIGTTGTRNISGTNPLILKLEQKIAEYTQKEQGVLFQSAWAANFFIKKLADIIPDIQIFSDAENHNSIIVPLNASKAKKNGNVFVFEHNNMGDLHKKLQNSARNQPKLILFEDKYSMSGQSAPINELEALSKEFDALLFCDVTHSFGLYNDMQRFKNVDILTGTLGKAVGSQGGFVATSGNLAELAKQSDTYIFTTSNSNANVAASLAALEVLDSKEGLNLRNNHIEIIELTKQKLTTLNVLLNATDGHIIPIEIGDEFKCKQVAQKLLEAGIYLQPIFYPTTPKGRAMLRLTPSALHTKQMVEDLVLNLKKVL
jgi:5-aminolevulinate synthase